MTIPQYAFCYEITVLPQHLDGLQHVNNIVYLQWIQEASARHWELLSTEAIRHKWIWVVSRHEIDYLRQCVLGDELQIFTWPEPPVGKTSARNVVVVNKKTKKQMMCSHTIWTILDANSKKAATVPQEVAMLLQ